MPPTGESGGSERLLLDAMLGSLATYLRMCGYDTAYALDRDVEADERLLALAATEDRTLVTRDAALADRTDGTLLLEAKDIGGQLRELRDAGVELQLASEPRRCGSCNGRLKPATDVARPDHVPEEGPIWRCVDCGKWFWKGSHWDDVRERLRRARAGRGSGDS